MLTTIIQLVIGATALTVFGGLFAAYVGLLERKLIGRIHSRYGPNMVGPFGMLQTPADALKFMQKDIVIPRYANKIIFASTPVLMTMLPFFILAFLPWGTYAFVASPYDALIVFSLIALNPVMILAAAWSSNSKYSTLGGFRAATQILAYEGVLFLSLLSIGFASGSFQIADMVTAQSNIWFIVSQPVAFIMFLLALIAVSERQPFDLPEAESELVQGWLTEYGGPFFAVILLGQYIMLYIGAFMVAALFFGGWEGYFGWYGMAMKVLIAVLIFIISRATYFRLRLDQLLGFSWKFLIPLGFVNFFATLIYSQVF